MKKTLISLALLSITSFSASAAMYDWEDSQKATLLTTVDSICGVEVRTTDDQLEVSNGVAKVEFFTLNNVSDKTTLKFDVDTNLKMNVGNANPLDLIDVSYEGSHSSLKNIRTLSDLDNETLTFNRRDFGMEQDGNVQGVLFNFELNAEHEQLMAGKKIKTTIIADVNCR
ncbi:hypothetical protein [Vibrio pomeroyi]|uniref:hypothetical protein n=3 Tax=Vibrio TaxID=662 RepID=UPI0021C323C4|nr:hypothetical protein [Vibrio pomeroyi]